jgi:hypothetical protein
MTLSIPSIDDDADALTAALAYIAAGLYVLPVKRVTKDPGSVVGKGWQHKSSRDAEQVVAWFAGTDHGIALHVGRSGAVVFDVDRPDAVPAALAEHLASAPYQSTRADTPGRGHYVFAQPAGRVIGNSVGRLGGEWGDVRGTNGVIIVAPSIHPSGGEYRWQRDGFVPILPHTLAELLPDATARDTDAATDAQVAEFLDAHTDATRPGLLGATIVRFREQVNRGRSRHETALSVAAWAMEEARAGLYDARAADEKLCSEFVTAMAEPRDGGRQLGAAAARREWAGIRAWAIGRARVSDAGARQARAGAAVDILRYAAEKAAAPAVSVRRTPVEQAHALAEARSVFRKWLGEGYDLDALDAVLATLAVERLDGDPVWLLNITGSGNAKTETVCSSASVDGVVITSSIASEGALLSATSKRERTAEANGGLLRKIGDRGTLVVKDVTTILSMDRTARAQVLAALREIYDGMWVRNVGTDGGREIPWRGRIAFVGAVTTAWDTHHSVVATMGDRFVLLRTSSREGRKQAGRQALRNIGSESQMRAELAAAVAQVLAGVDGPGATLTDDEDERLLAAADLVTLARTAVEYDYQGNPVQAHEPEMPTRFAKQLGQVLRGAVAIGMSRDAALRLALRCARDSMPPIRLAVIDWLAGHGSGGTSEIRRGVNLPRTTVDRQLQGLHMLGVLDCDEVPYGANGSRMWVYSLAEGVDPDALVIPARSESCPDLLVGRHTAQVAGGF